MLTGLGAILSGLMTSFGGPVPGFLAVLVMGLASLMASSESILIDRESQADFDLATFERLIVDDETEAEALEMLVNLWYEDSLDEETKGRVRVLLESRLIGSSGQLSYPGPAAYLVLPIFFTEDSKLTSPEVLTLENSRMPEVIEAIKESPHVIPADGHDQLIQSILALDRLDSQLNTVLDMVIALLARRGPEVEQQLATLEKDPRARLGVLRARVALAGVAEPWEAIWNDHGSTEAKTAFLQLQNYGSSMEWSGHRDFFGTEDARFFPAALRALKNHGHKEAFVVARRAALLLNPDGWSRNLNRRAEEIAQLSDDKIMAMMELDGKANDHRREILECSYEVVLANIDDFRGDER